MAAATLTCLIFVSPYLTREGPLWPALASGVTLAIFVVLAFRYDRWWLIGASGFQLVIFSTHFAPLIRPKHTLRLFLWGAIMALCVFAVGESRWAPYAQRQQAINARTNPMVWTSIPHAHEFWRLTRRLTDPPATSLDEVERFILQALSI